jgi:hypothetical protein
MVPERLQDTVSSHRKRLLTCDMPREKEAAFSESLPVAVLIRAQT